MSNLENLKNWLLSCPYLGADSLETEHTDPTPGSCGLYPLGLEILKDSVDILGNRTQHCRCRFLLRQVAAEKGADAQRLMDLQTWVQESRHAPKFGDVPEKERIYGENGHLARAAQTGCVLYDLTLTAEFIKKSKEN